MTTPVPTTDGDRGGLSRRGSVISPEEAGHALYIDFEGEKDKPPVLLGCANRVGRGAEPWAWQAVTSPLFGPLAAADGIEVLPLPDAVERILQRAEKRDRLIVAWSEHELGVVKNYCPEHLDRFEALYRNARTFAVHWRNSCHEGHRPATNTLCAYLALIGYEVPKGGWAGSRRRNDPNPAHDARQGARDRGSDGEPAAPLARPARPQCPRLRWDAGRLPQGRGRGGRARIPGLSRKLTSVAGVASGPIIGAERPVLSCVSPAWRRAAPSR